MLHSPSFPVTQLTSSSVVFVVEGKELHFSRDALVSGSSYFHQLLASPVSVGYPIAQNNLSTLAAASPPSQRIVFKRARFTAASAALRCCALGDENDFWRICRRCTQELRALEQCEGAKKQEHDAKCDAQRSAYTESLADLLSLYETCAQFDMEWHAEMSARALSTHVAEQNVLDVLAVCMRLRQHIATEAAVSVQPPHRATISAHIDILLRACLAVLPLPSEPTKSSSAGRKRIIDKWQKLQRRYAELRHLSLSRSPVEHTAALNLHSHNTASNASTTLNGQETSFWNGTRLPSEVEALVLERRINALRTEIAERERQHRVRLKVKYEEQLSTSEASAATNRDALAAIVLQIRRAEEELEARQGHLWGAQHTITESSLYVREAEAYSAALRDAAHELNTTATQLESSSHHTVHKEKRLEELRRVLVREAMRHKAAQDAAKDAMAKEEVLQARMRQAIGNMERSVTALEAQLA